MRMLACLLFGFLLSCAESSSGRVPYNFPATNVYCNASPVTQADLAGTWDYTASLVWTPEVHCPNSPWIAAIDDHVTATVILVLDDSFLTAETVDSGVPVAQFPVRWYGVLDEEGCLSVDQSAELTERPYAEIDWATNTIADSRWLPFPTSGYEDFESFSPICELPGESCFDDALLERDASGSALNLIQNETHYRLTVRHQCEETPVQEYYSLEKVAVLHHFLRR